MVSYKTKSCKLGGEKFLWVVSNLTARWRWRFFFLRFFFLYVVNGAPYKTVYPLQLCVRKLFLGALVYLQLINLRGA